MKKNKKLSTWIKRIILLAVIVFCLCKIIPYIWNNWQSMRQYEDLSSEYVTDDDGTRDDDWWYTNVNIDIAGLKEINPDVIAWIRFDDTDTICVDYPILQAEDSNEYLHTDMYGNYSYAGCLFIMDPESYNDPHCIIYGHNMRNLSMFGSLKRLKDAEVFYDNLMFTIYTEDYAYRFQIFSSFTTPQDGYVFQTGFKNDQKYKSYLTSLSNDADFITDQNPDKNDKTVTLSTCTPQSDNNRFTVHAVCVAKHELVTNENETQ